MNTVEGIGPDAPTVVHENGSKESLCLYALDVIPWTLSSAFGASDEVIGGITKFLNGGASVSISYYLHDALNAVLDDIGGDRFWAMLQVGAVLAEGERKYGADTNWHGISPRQHLRHALAHRFAHLAGDRSEGEIGHLTRTACRIAFAIDVLCRGNVARVLEETKPTPAPAPVVIDASGVMKLRPEAFRTA